VPRRRRARGGEHPAPVGRRPALVKGGDFGRTVVSSDDLTDSVLTYLLTVVGLLVVSGGR